MVDATIILAGGAGTRLWPASIRTSPKQLLRIGGGESLVQRAIRLAAHVTDGPIVIVTNADHVAGIAGHVAELESGSPGVAGRLVYLPEPVGRNTAPAIVLGATWLEREAGPGCRTLVLTADHLIGPHDVFGRDVDVAVDLASSGHLVCFGIRPDRPETGYGYIEAGEDLRGGFRVRAFTEKPDLQTAERYLASGGYYWNAGMFCFSISTFLAELGACAPDIATAFTRIEAGPGGSLSADPEALRPLYEQLPKISIDYALMEKSDRVAVVPASFSWNDVGSWDEVAAAEPVSADKSAADVPGLIEVESHDNHVESDLPVALCGVSNLHVVIRNGKALVCRRGQSQMVKQVVEEAESSGASEFLE